MKRIFSVVLLLLVSGCASGFEKDLSDYRFVTSGKKAGAAEDAELRAIAEDAWPLINNLIFCINRNAFKDIFINYEKRYVKYFNENMREAYHDLEKLKKINLGRKANIGQYISCELARVQKKFNYYTLFYKVKCTKIKGTGVIRMMVKRNDAGSLEITFLTFLPYK